MAPLKTTHENKNYHIRSGYGIDMHSHNLQHSNIRLTAELKSN